MGAAVVSTPGQTRKINSILPKVRSAIPLEFSSADGFLPKVLDLKRPSIVGIASVSNIFIKTARSVLQPLLDDRHELIDLRPDKDGRVPFSGVDIAFCDAVVRKRSTSSTATLYPLVSQSFVRAFAREMTNR